MDVNWQNITEVGSHAAKRNAIQVWGLSAHRVHGSSPQAGEAEGSEAARARCVPAVKSGAPYAIGYYADIIRAAL